MADRPEDSHLKSLQLALMGNIFVRDDDLRFNERVFVSNPNLIEINIETDFVSKCNQRIATICSLPLVTMLRMPATTDYELTMHESEVADTAKHWLMQYIPSL